MSKDETKFEDFSPNKDFPGEKYFESLSE